MGKGDQKSKRGKINAGSYGKKRPRNSGSVKSIPVKVLDEDDKKASKTAVRKEVGYPTEKSENAEVETKPKAAKPKAEKKADLAEEKPTAEKKDDKGEAKPKIAKPKKTEE